MHYIFTSHATAVMSERRIPAAWVERILVHPERVLQDRNDPALRHALGRIREYGDRVLRVVYNDSYQPWRIVTVYFDRSVRSKS